MPDPNPAAPMTRGCAENVLAVPFRLFGDAIEKAAKR